MKETRKELEKKEETENGCKCTDGKKLNGINWEWIVKVRTEQVTCRRNWEGFWATNSNKFKTNGRGRH